MNKPLSIKRCTYNLEPRLTPTEMSWLSGGKEHDPIHWGRFPVHDGCGGEKEYGPIRLGQFQSTIEAVVEK